MVNRIEPENIDLSADGLPEKKTDEQVAPQSDATVAADDVKIAVKTDKGVVSPAAAASPPPSAPAPSPDITNTAADPLSPADTPKKTPDEPKLPELESNEDDPAVVIQSARTHHFSHWLGRHAKAVIPVAVIIVVLAALAAVPMTRYAIAGLVVKQHYSVKIVDSQTGKPVSSATVTLKGQSTQTNNQGQATVTVPVGKATLSIEKKYYKSVSEEVLVPLKGSQSNSVSFQATGRQVPVTVVNKVTGKPLANAKLTAASTQVITDKNGEATIVLPADKNEAAGTITANNYNKATVTVKVTAAKDAVNTFKVTPSGKVYFLSNANGTVDVVKTDLDGQNRQTIVKGTGKEDASNTVLLASQNWKYLALLSKRDGGASAKLFVIDTSNDALSVMDEGDASFELTGWSGTTFVYKVNRNGKNSWDPKASAIKSYEAGAKKLAVLDETNASGTNTGDYFYEYYAGVLILNNEVVFAKSISSASPAFIGDHQGSFVSVRPDGTSKKTIKSWAPAAGESYVSLSVSAYEPNEVYVANTSTGNDPLYEYASAQLKAVDGKKSQDIWGTTYFTYLFSPTNDKTFWSEPRDGKNTLFIGDAKADNKKQVANLSEYQTFGWYTDDYVLVSKTGSELYIAPADAWDKAGPMKITDYYKPNFSASGYGKGYGGF